MFSPIEIAAVAGVAVLLFGADKLPKLARSMGQAKKEFLSGQEDAHSASVQPAPAEPASEKQPPNP